MIIKRKKALYYLVLLLLFQSCDENSGINNVFVGSYRIMDQMVPYPYIIKQNNYSLYLFNNEGILIDSIEDERIEKNKTIEFKEKHLKILNKKGDSFYAFDLSDSLKFKPYKNGNPNPKNCAKFTKIHHNIIDVEQLNNDLKSSIWKYNVVEDENSNPNKDLEIKQLLQFKKDSVTVLTDYYYQGTKTVSEYEKKAFTIFNIDDFYFLSFQKEQSNPQPLNQIINYNSERIELRDFSSSEVKNISFYRDSISSESYTESIEMSLVYYCVDNSFSYLPSISRYFW